MNTNKRRLKVSFNAPVVLGFTMICFFVLILDRVTNGYSTKEFFSVYRSSLTNLTTYVRFFGHVVGHVDWEHFMGNIMMLLVVGPLLEEKYGSYNILFVILSTALVTGIVNFIFYPNVQLLGASGVVFAFILLSSITSINDGKMPITFILVAIIYIGEQVYNGLFVKDNVANLTHIIGGFVGTCLGYIMNKYKMKQY